jgi:hypothetical protein
LCFLLLFFSLIHLVFFYNFGWTDMSVPSYHAVMNIVQVMARHILDRSEKVSARLGGSAVRLCCVVVLMVGGWVVVWW